MDVENNIGVLDETFSSYLLDKNERFFINSLEKALKAFSGNRTFKVTILNESGLAKEPFFGMRIFPQKECVDKIWNEIFTKSNASLSEMVKRWKTIYSWEIELDSRLFDKSVISFNPQELTAMLLHEIGHVVYSGKTSEMLFRVYKECQMKLSYENKASQKFLYKLYSIPTSIACGIRNWQLSSDDLREEVFADNSVAKLGYGEHLISAYQKIMNRCGNSSGYSDRSRMEASIAQSIEWCNVNVEDLGRRQTKLKDELFETGQKTNSKYLRKIVVDIMNALHIHKKERYTGAVVMESSITLDFDDANFTQESTLVYDQVELNKLLGTIHAYKETAKREIATEAFGRKKKDVIPNQLDVDTILVEVDRMTNHADRRYVLDLIYHQEEKIEAFKEQFKYNKELKSKYELKMNSMLKELASMRMMVLSRRSFDREYKVFVKYPAGYEG